MPREKLAENPSFHSLGFGSPLTELSVSSPARKHQANAGHSLRSPSRRIIGNNLPHPRPEIVRSLSSAYSYAPISPSCSNAPVRLKNAPIAFPGSTHRQGRSDQAMSALRTYCGCCEGRSTASGLQQSRTAGQRQGLFP